MLLKLGGQMYCDTPLRCIQYLILVKHQNTRRYFEELKTWQIFVGANHNEQIVVTWYHKRFEQKLLR